MNGFQAAVLGLVQGVTEFLPISSSAHLILASFFLGWPDQGLYFDIAVHLGSMVAVVLFLRGELWEMGKAVAGVTEDTQRRGRYRKLAGALAVGTIPVAIAGPLLRGFVASTGRQPVLIAATSIAFGVALLAADRVGSKDQRLDRVGWRDGLWIGIAQALALVPGTSRAGITMTVALALGYDRASAARFSFLLAIPVSGLVAVRQLLGVVGSESNSLHLTSWVVGFVVSGVAAYLGIEFLVGWVKRQDFSLFVIYRILLGFVILGTLWLGSAS